MTKSAKAKHDWYIRNKAEVYNRNKIRRQQRKTMMQRFLSYQKCCVCGESENVCLDFHHINEQIKKDEVMRMLNSFRSIKDVVAEMNKCCIVCSNCHRKIHAGLIVSDTLNIINVNESALSG